MIRITYVTITFNAAKVLQRTLDSVLSQDYPDIVHLIIDGASTDGTLQLVNDYIERSNASENGHHVQVMSEPDKGIYDAMNKGLRSLDGDYVCYLNAGDFLPASDTAASPRWLTPVVACLLCSMVTQISWMVKDVSCIIAGSHLLSNSHGNHSVKACSSAIRRSMPVPISPSLHPTTCNTVIRQMSIGASV